MTKDELLEAIRSAAEALGHLPSRSEFLGRSGVSEWQVHKHFTRWNEAVAAAGLEPNVSNRKLKDDDLLQDWARVVREQRAIPTTTRYRHSGNYSPDAFDRHFGPWSAVPDKFRQFAEGKCEYADVLAILSSISIDSRKSVNPSMGTTPPDQPSLDSGAKNKHSKLNDRPTYGNPIDFRGLRHEPVNEQGVVFLFGMVARELGYHVEAVQMGFPDCEAKRQVERGKWQRVRIEFEFESRNFRDHGHSPDGCDAIVCWRHNWTECPDHIEVMELSSVIQSLAKHKE